MNDMPRFFQQNLEDWIEEVISDSLGPDWQPRDAARHLMLHLSDGPYRISHTTSDLRTITWENPDGPGAA